MKICTDCKQSKSIINFSKCAKHGDGLSYKCKQCAYIYAKSYNIKNKEKIFNQRRENISSKKLAKYIPRREQTKINAKNHRQHCLDNKDTLTKQCNKCLIEKTLSLFDIGSKEKDGFQYTCKECCRSFAKEYRAENADEERERHAKYHVANKEAINARIALWAKNNPDKVRAKSRRFYENNTESEKARMKAWSKKNKEWVKNYNKQYRIDNAEYFKKYDNDYWRQNKSKVYAKNANRRAKRNMAFVSWANQDAIKDIYIQSQLKTQETGIIHHVDHIIPLINEKVCGLHNEFNLQILTAHENLSKSNKFEIV